MRARRTWLVIGTAAGVLAVAIAAAIPKDEWCVPGEPTTQQCLDDRNALLALGIPAAAVEGAAIGALFKTDRWLAVPPENLRLSLAAAGGRGVGLSLAVRF